MRIAVLGDGGWGTTLALLLARKGPGVMLWSPFSEAVEEMRGLRENRRYLPGVPLPSELALTSDPTTALDEATWAVVAIPSRYLRATLGRFDRGRLMGMKIVSAIKGMETDTRLRASQVIHEVTGATQLAVLAGPNVANEVVRGDPTLAVAAAPDVQLAEQAREMFMTEQFRIYTSTDLVGVELGGVLKNVMAIAAGISDGLGYGANAKAALVTRALVEMTRLGEALGGQQSTFFGLSGLGDLVTTCFNQKSRNRRAGEALAQGQSVAEVEQTIGGVVEGFSTAKAVYELAQARRVEMPIATEVARVLYEGKHPKQALRDLMLRPVGTELQG